MVVLLLISEYQVWLAGHRASAWTPFGMVIAAASHLPR